MALVLWGLSLYKPLVDLVYCNGARLKIEYVELNVDTLNDNCPTTFKLQMYIVTNGRSGEIERSFKSNDNSIDDNDKIMKIDKGRKIYLDSTTYTFEKDVELIGRVQVIQEFSSNWCETKSNLAHKEDRIKLSCFRPNTRDDEAYVKVGRSYKSRGQSEYNPAINSFYIDKYEVTESKYRDYLIGKNELPVQINSLNFPKVNVSWEAAQCYCQSYGKRLPSKSEWLLAANGGLAGSRTMYSGSNSASEVSKPGNELHGVGMYRPNELGIYDMSGGVWEWLGDTCKKTQLIGSYYAMGGRNSKKTPTIEETRCLIGRSRYDDVGFRCVREREDVVNVSPRIDCGRKRY